MMRISQDSTDSVDLTSSSLLIGISLAAISAMALVSLTVSFTIGHPHLISELKVEDKYVT